MPMDIDFDWNPSRREQCRQDGVRFEDAMTVFATFARTMLDRSRPTRSAGSPGANPLGNLFVLCTLGNWRQTDPCPDHSVREPTRTRAQYREEP